MAEATCRCEQTSHRSRKSSMSGGRENRCTTRSAFDSASARSAADRCAAGRHVFTRPGICDRCASRTRTKRPLHSGLSLIEVLVALAQEGLPRRQEAHDAVNPRSFQGLLEAQGRQDRRQALGQHGLAGPGRPHHKDIVAPGCCQKESPLHRLLAPHLFPLWRRVRPKVTLMGLRREELVPFLAHSLGKDIPARFEDAALSALFEQARGLPALVLASTEECLKAHPKGTLSAAQIAEILDRIEAA